MRVRDVERGGSKLLLKCKILLCIGIIGHGNNSIAVQDEHKVAKCSLRLKEILCVCQEKRLMLKGHGYVKCSRPYSSTIQYTTGLKVVFVYMSCQRFLRGLDNVANITI